MQGVSGRTGWSVRACSLIGPGVQVQADQNRYLKVSRYVRGMPGDTTFSLMAPT